MPARARLTDAQVKKIRRRVRAGARQTELAVEYGVNRKTIRRRLVALELAEQARRVEHMRSQRRGRRSQKAARGEQPSLVSGPGAAASRAGR